MDLHHVRRGAGEPLLMIQGMSGTHAAWGDPFLSHLEPAFDCITYDHRGIGFSPKITDPFSIVDLADDAAKLLDHLGLESAHVIGISMGGMVAQELALRHGERIRTLTLGCTYCGGPGSSLIDPADGQKLMTAFGSGDRDVALRVGFELNTSDAFRADPSRFQAFKEMALSAPSRLPTIMLQMQAIGGHDTQDRLGEIRTPTLVVHGTEDRMVPYPNGELIASKVPDAHLATLEGVGHMFWWERPEESAALLREHAGIATTA
jgi:pimeloyl-ACP methyl ester carboxylesterase